MVSGVRKKDPDNAFWSINLSSRLRCDITMRNTKPRVVSFFFGKEELLHELSDSHTLAMNKSKIELNLKSKEQLSNLKHRMFSLLLFLNYFFSAGIGRVCCS